MEVDTHSSVLGLIAKFFGRKVYIVVSISKYLVIMPEEIDTGLKRLLDFSYGNHPKRQLLKAKGAIVVKFLREGPKTLSELAVGLGLDLKKPAELSQFYAALRPLRETGMISTHRSQGKTFYALSYASFRFALEQLRKDAEYWLKEEGT